MLFRGTPGIDIFLSTPSARRATLEPVFMRGMCETFLSTPSARRATIGAVHQRGGLRISIHALREEGDRGVIGAGRGAGDFYPRPPRGGRRRVAFALSRSSRFLSTPSARRATGKAVPQDAHGLFLSTPSARRATGWLSVRSSITRISIHALREEGDAILAEAIANGLISIHALREEGDPTAWWPLLTGTYFYPRPPRGGRPSCKSMWCRAGAISIHALREEGDLAFFISNCVFGDFYPRPPRGGRHGDSSRKIRAPYISIHALREEGDVVCARFELLDDDFYPRPPRGGRRWYNHQRSQGYIFLSTPSARRATVILCILICIA